MENWNKKICAGLALVLAVGCTLGAHSSTEAITPPNNGNTVKRKTHTTTKRTTHNASLRITQHRSAHNSAARRVSSNGTRSMHRVAPRRVSSKSMRSTPARRRAQLRPEPQRIQEIQQALAQVGYLNGQPSGQWDDQTRQAMRRYQADHGFPETGLPEAKSLMKLGLGPHPLPEELDTSGSPTRASGETINGAPAPPDTQPDPPATGGKQ